MKGFDRKVGRSTKGGSLLPKTGAPKLVSVSFPGPARQKSSENGANGNSSLGQDSSPEADSTSPNGGASSFGHGTILNLAAPEPLAANRSSANGRHELSQSRGNSRPAEPTDSAISGRSLQNGSRAARIPRWKRIFDVTCIVLSSVCWLPLMILVMAWVRVTSPGPIFYRQERVGYRRSRFMIFKFRTMHVHADTRTHEEYFAQLMREERPMTKLDAAGDSRLIPGGRFIRASGLDELPQIFNVLRGDMSLVGPRPCLPSEFARYETWQQRRLDALPGLTGQWQVNGKNNTTFNEMIALDLFYVSRMSIWLDLAIISRTIPTLIREIFKARQRSSPGCLPGIGHTQSHLAEGLNGAVEKI